VEAYLAGLVPSAGEVRQIMEEWAEENNFPIVGPQVGAFLAQLVRLSGAKRIFELGSGFGYSALWMAAAMGEAGSITCTELDMQNIERGRRWLRDAGMDSRVNWHCGDALMHLEASEGSYDLILNDIDKHQYPEALRRAWPRVRPGGLLITDNVLWSGRVASALFTDRETESIREYTRMALALPDALSTIIPLRDGLLVSLKV
jgi:predicted O-methyltransferase YrrM